MGSSSLSLQSTNKLSSYNLIHIIIYYKKRYKWDKCDMCCEMKKIVCCKYYSLVLPDQQYAGLPQWHLSLLSDLLPTLCWWQQAANQIWVGKWESAIFVFSLLLTSLMISSNITLNKTLCNWKRVERSVI